MRATILRGLLVTAALLANGRAAWAGGGAITWRRSLPVAQAEAVRSHKLLMVDFTTVWCGFCKKMDAETYVDSTVIRLSENVVPIKIDAEREGKRLAEKYGVDVYPTILFLNENGGVEGSMSGFVPAFDFTQTFNATMKRHQDFVAARTRFQKNGSDVQAAFDLEGFYAAQGNGARTIAMQQQVERLDPRNAHGLLARSCLYLGDFYSMRHQYARSVSSYRRALHITKTPLEKAYGHLSIAYCSLSQKQFKQALPELKAVQAVPNCPPQLKGAAEELIAKLRAQGVR